MACVCQHFLSAQRALPVAVSVVYQGVAVPGAKSTVGFQRPSSLAAATASAAIAEFTPSPFAHSASPAWPSTDEPSLMRLSSEAISSLVIGACVQPTPTLTVMRDKPMSFLMNTTGIPFDVY